MQLPVCLVVCVPECLSVCHSFCMEICVCVSVCVFACVPKMVTLCSEEPENDLIWIASVILKIEVVLKNWDAQM